MASSACVTIVLVIAVVLVVYGFLQLFGREKATENDVQVVQRQIRGFACILLAQVILVLGVGFCLGEDGIQGMIRSIKEI